MPEVSVIVPVYKVEQYFDRCVESILAQTFTDFELILVDDGSPDNCPQMCDDWAKKDNRIRVLHKHNEGVSKARNDAVQLAVSEYISFVDSDDWIYPEFLEVLYNNLKNTDADISVCMASRNDKEREPNGEVTVYDNRNAILNFAIADDERFRSCWAKLIKRSILLDFPFPIDRSYSEDMAVIYKWYYAATKVVCIEQYLYYYFINESGVSNQTYGLHRLGDLKTWHELMEFIKNEKFDEIYEGKIMQYANALYTQHNKLVSINELKIANLVKGELIKVVKNNKSITIKNQSHIFNMLYPMRSKIYWTIKGLLGV